MNSLELLDLRDLGWRALENISKTFVMKKDVLSNL